MRLLIFTISIVYLMLGNNIIYNVITLDLALTKTNNIYKHTLIVPLKVIKLIAVNIIVVVNSHFPARMQHQNMPLANHNSKAYMHPFRLHL